MRSRSSGVTARECIRTEIGEQSTIQQRTIRTPTPPYFEFFLGLSRPAMNFSNSMDLAISNAACSIRSVAVSLNFSASCRSCSEDGLSGIVSYPYHKASRHFGTLPDIPGPDYVSFPPTKAAPYPKRYFDGLGGLGFGLLFPAHERWHSSWTVTPNSSRPESLGETGLPHIQQFLGSLGGTRKPYAQCHKDSIRKMPRAQGGRRAHAGRACFLPHTRRGEPGHAHSSCSCPA